MYALANVRKFVEDNADEVGDRAEEILARAEKESNKGIFTGVAVERIMQDEVLERMFGEAVSDLEHVEIGLSALRAAGE